MRTILSRALAELNARQSVMLVTIVAEQGSAPKEPRQSNAGGCEWSANGHHRRWAGERQSSCWPVMLRKGSVPRYSTSPGKPGQTVSAWPVAGM